MPKPPLALPTCSEDSEEGYQVIYLSAFRCAFRVKIRGAFRGVASKIPK